MRIPATDTILMTASVCLAALLWLWVGAEERSEIVITAPLEYRNLPKDFEISSEGQPLTSVNVWVKGSTDTIKNLRPQEISVWVDLAKARPGAKNYELTPENVTVPYGFSVLRISPSRIHLRIEHVVIRMAPVVPRLEGEPPPGFTVSEASVTPSQVQIIGPESAVSSVRNVITDSIDVSTVKGTHVETVNLGVENATVRLGKIKQVTVSLRVSEIQDMLTLRRVPVSVTGTRRNTHFNPKTVRIDLMAPKRLLAEISDDKVKAVLDLDGLKPGVYELTPRVLLDPQHEKSVMIKEVVPERIHVHIL